MYLCCWVLFIIIFLGVWCYCDIYVGTYILVYFVLVFLLFLFICLVVWCYCDIYVRTYVPMLLGFWNYFA